MAKLAEYRKKRDPKKTPEPFGGRKKGKQPIFVVQRHDARRLHYDFRLERNGALASWAVPKGIPLEPGQQRLAVHVDDKKDGGLTVRLHGKRLEGTYAVVPAKLDGDPKNWLILRKREDGAAPAERRRRSYSPMFATLSKDVPSGGEWEF